MDSVPRAPATALTAAAAAAVLLLVLAGIATGQTASDEQTGWPLVYASPDDPVVALTEVAPTDPAAWRAHPGGELELLGPSAYEPKVRSPRSIAWLEHPAVGSFVLELEMKQTGRDYGHRDLCLFFGRQDTSRFYYVHLATKADPNAHNIFIVDAKPRRSFARRTTAGIDWGRDVYRKVRLERNLLSGSIKVFFEDMSEPIMEAEDRTFGVGRIGLGSFDDAGRFRNLRLYTPKRPAGWRGPKPSRIDAVPTLADRLVQLGSSPEERWRIVQGGLPVWGHVGDYDPQAAFETARAFDHLYGPGSGARITKGAKGGPYSHHRGVMAGWSRTKIGEARYDFWHCRDVSIRHDGWLAEAFSVDEDTIRLAYRSQWMTPDGTAVVAERRDITIRPLPDLEVPARLYDYVVTLRALTEEAIILGGDPQHAGLQIRMVAEVGTREKETVYLRPEGARSEGNDVWEACDWVAGRFTVAGRVIWVLHLASPALPRPLVYSTRAYGRFGAFFETTLLPGQDHRFPFRLAVAEGEMELEALRKLADSLSTE